MKFFSVRQPGAGRSRRRLDPLRSGKLVTEDHFSQLTINELNCVAVQGYAHIVMEADGQRGSRDALESLISADLREISAESDQIGRQFAMSHRLRPNDFRALMYVMVAEGAGRPMTSGDLSQRMGLSGSAITYLVDRLIDSGHIRRDSHPDDRRKVVLRHGETGLATARSFFSPLGALTRVALEELPDADLMAAHRVLGAMIDAMQRFQGDESGPRP